MPAALLRLVMFWSASVMILRQTMAVLSTSPVRGVFCVRVWSVRRFVGEILAVLLAPRRCVG